MTFSSSRSAWLSALALCALCAWPAAAEETGISGLWVQQHAEHGRRDDPPVLTAQAQADEAARRADANRVMGKQECLPVGMPRMLMNELPFEIIESPERIGIIGEQAELARTIYLNTTVHPADVEPSWMGNSYGKWENGVLVVDVANFNDRISHIPGVAKGSTTTHLVERFHLENGGKVLVDEMTFEDPKVLAKPYRIVNHYDRLPPGSQRWEYVCDVNDPMWNTALGYDPNKAK
ncbi:MAG TPA: hypothetical protein VG960_09820 [Caulobacteraceae bacterium]|nr:hypothetical protein [Caulobacteraceae bacterium]